MMMTKSVREQSSNSVQFFPIGSRVKDKETHETGQVLSIWSRLGNAAMSNTMLLVQYDEEFVDPTDQTHQAYVPVECPNDQTRQAYVPVECLELLIESAEFIRI